MADPKPAGTFVHVIPVECDLAASTLDLTVPTLGIKPGDYVLWQFFGLSDAWTPWIEFHADLPFLGPFTHLTQSGAAVWGQCSDNLILNRAPNDDPSFRYRAVVRKGSGTTWESGTATIQSGGGRLTLDVAKTASTQQFTVTKDGDKLSVSPIGVVILANDTVEWDFSQIPAPDLEDWRPQVSFQGYDGSRDVPNLNLGPFTSMTTGKDHVRGMGNNLIPGTYYFRASVVRVRDGSVVWISSPDPAVDNRGGVGDPTSTGGGN